MAFLDEFRKFLGGLVGDERTNAGIAINRGDPTKEAKRNWRAVPFSYRSTGENGYPKMRTGFLKVPFYADIDRDDNLLKQDNSNAIALLGIELDDGTQLDYNQSKDFLNRFTPDSIKFTIDNEDRDSFGQEATGANPNYQNNLRKRIKYVADNAPGEYALPNIPSMSYIKNTPTSKFIEALRHNYTPIDSSNTRKYSVLSDVDGYKAVTDASLNSLKDRQSRDFRGNRLDSRYYNYIPFSYDGEGGVQYGLIQTPSFAEDEIVNVYLDNGVNMGAKDAMDFLSSVKTSNALHLPRKQFSYKEFSGLSPTDWLNNMRKKYLQKYPDTYYSRGTNEAIRRYNLTGEL